MSASKSTVPPTRMKSLGAGVDVVVGGGTGVDAVRDGDTGAGVDTAGGGGVGASVAAGVTGAIVDWGEVAGPQAAVNSARTEIMSASTDGLETVLIVSFAAPK